jgi:7,8-dihydroneopterin aldolase/epimerase/oxygenase
MDRVFLNGLSVHGKHGVMPRERKVEQEFIVDIVATVDTTAAAASDTLDDTVDYVRFRDIAEHVIKTESHYLIERVADRIATRIMEDARIQEISITIQKPAVLPNGIPGITITRARA